MFYATIDSSIYKTCLDENGDDENSVIIVPKISHPAANVAIHNGKNIAIDTYNWSVQKVNSNFKNAVGKKTFATVTPLTPTNQRFVSFKVNNIQDGEVVFVHLACAIEDSRYSGHLDDLHYEFGGIIYSNQVAYRGDPINTEFKIWTSNNGKIEQSIIYDSPIELTIEKANTGDSFFFPDISVTANGSKETIANHLERWEHYRDNNIDFSTIETSVPTSQRDAQGNVNFKVKSASRFIQKETVFYSHGRSLDTDSIETLLYQNPRNSIGDGVLHKPDPQHFYNAHQNRRRQSPGYNSYIYPLLNPIITESSTVPFFFPGRSGHGGVGGGTKCGTCQFDYTWSPPGYPDCPHSPEKARAIALNINLIDICAGQNTCTENFCFDIPCNSNC